MNGVGYGVRIYLVTCLIKNGKYLCIYVLLEIKPTWIYTALSGPG